MRNKSTSLAFVLFGQQNSTLLLCLINWYMLNVNCVASEEQKYESCFCLVRAAKKEATIKITHLHFEEKHNEKSQTVFRLRVLVSWQMSCRLDSQMRVYLKSDWSSSFRFCANGARRVGPGRLIPSLAAPHVEAAGVVPVVSSLLVSCINNSQPTWLNSFTSEDL